MTSMLWEEVWDAVNGHFEAVAESLRETNPAISWSCGHSDNQSFPFRAYASFVRRSDPAADEDVVIALDVHKSASRLRLTTDISRGDGEILADGPSTELSLKTDTRSLHEEVLRWVDASLEFVDAHGPLLQSELAPQ